MKNKATVLLSKKERELGAAIGQFLHLRAYARASC